MLRMTARRRNFCRSKKTNARFLKSSLYAFAGGREGFFLKRRACRFKTERGERAAFVSDNANDIIADTLERMAKAPAFAFVRERLADIQTESGHVSAAVTDRTNIPAGLSFYAPAVYRIPRPAPPVTVTALPQSWATLSFRRAHRSCRWRRRQTAPGCRGFLCGTSG